MNPRIESLFQPRGWANRRTLDSLLACPAAQPAALPLFAHVLAAEHVWLSRLNGQTPRLAVWPTLSIEECQSLVQELDSAWDRALQSHSDGDLLAEVEYRTTRGDQFRSKAIDILLQVITHGPHHRGQIARIIRECGGEPASLDYILFARRDGAS